MADEIDATADRMDNELSLILANTSRVTDPRSGERVDSCGRCRDARGIA